MSSLNQINNMCQILIIVKCHALGREQLRKEHGSVTSRPYHDRQIKQTDRPIDRHEWS